MGKSTRDELGGTTYWPKSS